YNSKSVKLTSSRFFGSNSCINTFICSSVNCIPSLFRIFTNSCLVIVLLPTISKGRNRSAKLCFVERPIMINISFGLYSDLLKRGDSTRILSVVAWPYLTHKFGSLIRAESCKSRKS
ncbi:unnamed protein product, partial [Schistosoma margrebowiei]